MSTFKRPANLKFNANSIPVAARSESPPSIYRRRARADYLLTFGLLRFPEKPSSDSDSASESSSESETEDEDGEELTPVMDAAILRTLSRIRRGEGVESGRNVFEGMDLLASFSSLWPINSPDTSYVCLAVEETAALLASNQAANLASKPRTKSSKPLLLADFQRQALLDASNTSAYPSDSNPLPTHAEEQEALRKETLDAFKVDVGEAGDDESGGLFVKKGGEGGADGGEDMEDEEYRAFLLGSGGGEAGVREALGLGVASEKQDGEDAEDGEGSESEKGEGDEVPLEGEGEKKKRKRTKRKKKEVVPMTEEEKKQKDEEFLLEYVLHLSTFISICFPDCCSDSLTFLTICS
jgi:protein KRI1